MLMRKFWFSSFLVALFAIGFTASDKTEGLPEDAVIEPVVESELTGIVKLDSHIADWDAGYLTKFGYFTFSKDVNTEEEGKFSSVSFMSVDGNEMATLIITKDENVPTQLVVKDQGIVYFSFPNDTIVELLYDNGEAVEFLGSYDCRKADFPSFSDLDKTDVFRAALANAAYVINANTSGETIKPAVASLVGHFADLFKTIGNMNYETNDTEVSKIPVHATGDYLFAVLLSDWYRTEIVVRIYNTISLWTGKATFKVGGSSCTLSGTVWCPADVYNALGTYGIVCDANKDNLFVGEGGAEYQDTGFQPYGTLSFDVDFRGLKPNTTYYYRAYYKFNDFSHGTLIPRYGNATDNVLYDTTIKSFTTGDNLLTVDVVMCIDFTGSMGGIINTVKNNALSFYDSFKAKCDDLGIGLTGMTTQVIGYQDINVDGANWWKQSPTYQMPEQREAFTEFVNGIYAMGGGDKAESGLEALNAAFSKSDWGIDDGYHRQVVILWTDAPYLVGSGYTAMTVEGVKAKWDAMPSGRRMILFAPSGNYEYNGGDWDVMNDWKNVIHITNLSSGFYDMDYILESIIGELTSKSRSASYSKPKNTIKIVSRPNK